MAINFPDTPTNGQTYNDPGTGQTWTYELATNSWTASSLAVTGGVVYKGSVDITAAPPTGAKAGEQWSIGTGGTANAGYGPGVTGTVTKGGMVMYTGSGWLEVSHSVPDATTVAKGIDTRKWDRTGTALSPSNAGDSVGIGTSTPNSSFLLDVATGAVRSNGGGFYVSENYSSANHVYRIYDNSSQLAIESQIFGDPCITSAPIVFRTSSSDGRQERLRITPAGFVGIGTSSPAARLDLGGEVSDTVNIRFTMGGNVATIGSTGSGVANGKGDLTFATRNGSAMKTAMTIDGSQRVGIGTATPNYSLDVNGDIALTEYNVLGWHDGDGNKAGDIHVTPSENTVFRRGASNIESMRIDASGRLLVGTSATAQPSTVVLQGRSGGTDREAILRLCRGSATPSNGATLGELAFGDSGNLGAVRIYAARDAGTWTSGSSHPTKLTFATTADGTAAPTERMKITSSGGLQCLGVYSSTTSTAANVNVDSNGTLQRSTSSQKYKTDIETLKDSYADALLACRPVWYKSTCAADNPEWGYWGFIAEEVAAVDPRLVQWKTSEVTYDENGSVVVTPLDVPEPESVQYDRFVPHLLNLVKRQGEAIADLQAEVAALKAS